VSFIAPLLALFLPLVLNDHKEDVMRKYAFISLMFFTALVLSTLLSSCSGGGGNGDNIPSPEPQTSIITGVAFKGPISDGSVSVNALNSDGSMGSTLGTDVTTSDGLFSVDIGSYSGDVLIKVTGGTYTDEATGDTKTNSELRAAVTDVNQSLSVAVSALSEIAVQLASLKGGLTKTNVEKANTIVSNMLGGIDICKVPPSPAGAVPIPYPNVAFASDALSEKAVTIDGDMPTCLKETAFDLSEGDEPGTTGPVLDTTGPEILDALAKVFDPANPKNEENLTLDDTVLDEVIGMYIHTPIPSDEIITYHNTHDYLVYNDGDIHIFSGSDAGDHTWMRREVYSSPASFGGYDDLVKIDVDGYEDHVLGIPYYLRETTDGYFLIFETGEEVKLSDKAFSVGIQYTSELRTVEVVGFEDVDTPAGIFNDCLKIKVTSSDKIDYYWYASDVGLVKYADDADVIELLIYAEVDGVRYGSVPVLF
jgi:hypothetical protein